MAFNRTKNKRGITVTIDLDMDKTTSLLEEGSSVYRNLDSAKDEFYAAFSRLAHIFEDIRGDRISDYELKDPDFLKKELARITSEDSVLSGIQKMLNGEFTGREGENLLLGLYENDMVTSNTDLMKALTGYVSSYDKYFTQFNNTIGYMESLGSTIRGEKVLHQFGFVNENSYREVYMDESTMKLFRQDRDIFRLRVQSAKDEVGRYVFNNDDQAIIKKTGMVTRSNLQYDTLSNSLDALSKTNGIGLFFDARYGENSKYGNLAVSLFNDSSFAGGRANEALLAGMIRGDPTGLNPNDYKDNLAWYWGGDKNIMIDGQRYNISQKSINFDAGGNAYGFQLSSEKSLQYFERMLYDKNNDYELKDTSTFFNRLFYNWQEADIVTQMENLPSDLSDGIFNDVMSMLYSDIQDNVGDLGFETSGDFSEDLSGEELPEGW